MRALICFMFKPCDWRWLCDVMVKDGRPSRDDPLGEHPHQTGLYQCARCRALSLGAPRA
jgi:hypothetical protein